MYNYFDQYTCKSKLTGPCVKSVYTINITTSARYKKAKKFNTSLVYTLVPYTPRRFEVPLSAGILYMLQCDHITVTADARRLINAYYYYLQYIYDEHLNND